MRRDRTSPEILSANLKRLTGDSVLAWAGPSNATLARNISRIIAPDLKDAIRRMRDH